MAPSSLGNGLVHDTRAAVDASVHVAQLAESVAWSSFVDSNTAMLRRGFRPAQINADVAVTDELSIVDNTVYISDDDANYRTEVVTHVFDTLASERAFDEWEPVALGARPTSIDSFYDDGHVGYSVAWVYDSPTNNPAIPWTMKVGQSAAELEALLADPGYRPLSLSSRRRAGATEYAVILIATDSPGDWPVSLDVWASGLADEIAARWDEGYYPYRITSKDGDSARLDVLWAKRPPGISVQVRVNLTDATFEAEDGWARSHGYHLETADTYAHSREIRRVAVWVRYEPYLRWVGTEVIPAQYEMFHAQALRFIAGMTEVDCSGNQPCPAGTACNVCSGDSPCLNGDVCVDGTFGQRSFPSATLHVFEGSTVVLNRAYTFGPAVYEDTELDAAFRVASVSKSITATAVLRELDIQQRSPNLPFHGVTGILPEYFLEYPSEFSTLTVRVRDVLDHQGGFSGTDPISYSDHSLLVNAGAVPPIDGEDLFEYVFALPPDGHVDLGAMHGDSYWQPEWFYEDRNNGVLRYSNSGYSLAGEIVRIQSGMSYREYVIDNILTPLGFQNRVFPDPGSRVEMHGPSLALSRNYLTDGLHPYSPNSPQPEPPRTGLANNPVIEPSDWATYFGPNDPRAPERASDRYGGGYYLGGAALAAGGWWGDGEVLGHLIRIISQTDLLVPQSVSLFNWHPGFWNFNHSWAPGWAYVHGWYARGNWVGWFGSAKGGSGLVVHNRVYNVTIVLLANGLENPSGFINPLMLSPNLVLGGSEVGQLWPCVTEMAFAPFDTCKLPPAAIY